LRHQIIQFVLLFAQQVAQDRDQHLQRLALGQAGVVAEVLADPLQLEPQLSARLHGGSSFAEKARTASAL
jgi:hypothetical protein